MCPVLNGQLSHGPDSAIGKRGGGVASSSRKTGLLETTGFSLVDATAAEAICLDSAF